jgi:RNA-directed DNA polymerase
VKRWKNLYPEICSFANLLDAARKAQRGKRFRPDVYAFHARLEENLLALQRELEACVWQPGGYRDFFVQESKRRLISAAPYRDRVVHHALCNVIEPLFERCFIHDSYACRKGKGTHAAADRYTMFSRKARFVLKCDVAGYFPSIDHEVLYEQLARRIADDRALWLCEAVIRSKDDEGLLWPSGRGIPIGNQTSQFFANVYLDGFDHWMKEAMGCRWYIRYVDDFVVLDDSKGRLHALIPEIEAKLAELRLTLHARKRTVFPVTEGCDFMGYRIWPFRRRLRPENGYRFQRKLARMLRAYRENRLDAERIHASIMSWEGHAAHADTRGLRRAVLGGTVFPKGQAGRRKPRPARRRLEQQRKQQPLGQPQQEQPGEYEQQQRVSCGAVAALPQASPGQGSGLRGNADAGRGAPERRRAARLGAGGDYRPVPALPGGGAAR